MCAIHGEHDGTDCPACNGGDGCQRFPNAKFGGTDPRILRQLNAEDRARELHVTLIGLVLSVGAVSYGVGLLHGWLLRAGR
jgi:hypothetical protein